MTTARRTRRKAAHRQVIIESLGWIVAGVTAAVWIATEWRSWLMVVVGVLVSTAAGMLGAVWMVHQKTRIVSTKPAKREPSLINPPRSKDKATWPTYAPSEIPEMRKPEAQTATDPEPKKQPVRAARQRRRAARAAKRQKMPPPLSVEESRTVMSRLLDEDSEPKDGFNEVKWEPVSVDEHREQFHQALESSHSDDPIEDVVFEATPTTVR